MKKKRKIRPFCPSCGADIEDPTESCKDSRGCGKIEDLGDEDPSPPDPPAPPEHVSGDEPHQVQADFERLHPWKDRDRVFDAWIKTQIRTDTGAEHKIEFASWDGDFGDEHTRIAAWAVKPGGASKGNNYVSIIYASDNNTKEHRKDGKISQAGMCYASSDAGVNNVEQARAIVRALRWAFGESVIESANTHRCGPYQWIYATPSPKGPAAVLLCMDCGKKAPLGGETFDTSVIGKVVPSPYEAHDRPPVCGKVIPRPEGFLEARCNKDQNHKGPC